MKKVIGLTLTLLVVASTSWAGFGLPKVKTGNSTVNNLANKGINKAATKGLEKAINDKIKKLGCSFADETSTATTCNLDKLVRELSLWRQGLEGTIANDFNIYVEAGGKKSTVASSRGNFVRNKIKSKIGYWDYYVQTKVGKKYKKHLNVYVRASLK